MTHRQWGWCAIGVVVAIGLVAPPASPGQVAKGKTGAAAPLEIEEITVTAQKREENLQEIPISVTAVTGAALEEKGVSAVVDLVQSVPNIFVAEGTTQGSQTTFGMRATQIGDNSLSQNPSVGLYIDGVYIAKAQFSNLDIEDLDRVEVMRGPQGTLYGKNTIGGAVNLVTKKPTEERSITALTEVGNYDSFKARVTANVPLIGNKGFWQSDAVGTLSLRENLSYRSHEPYIDNRSPTDVKESGGAGFKNLNRVFNMTSLRWQPLRNVTVDYAFEYHRYRDLPGTVQVTYIYPQSLADDRYHPAVFPPGVTIPNPIYPGGLTPYLQKNRVLSMGNNGVYTTPDGIAVNRNLTPLGDSGNHRMHFLTAAWDLGDLGPLGSATVKSIGAYRSTTADSSSDIDGSPLHYYDSLNHFNLDTWSEELQWIATAPRVHYVLGLFYYGEHTTEKSSQVLLNGRSPSLFVNNGKVQSYAGFTQATWTPPILQDKLSVTAGLRLSQDDVGLKRKYTSVSSTSRNIWNKSVAKSFGIHGTAFPGLSPMADVSYQWTDNLMTYFRVSRGYQSGAANGRAGDPISFSHMVDPEKLLAYEAGFKSQWFDNRLRLNADGFFSDYTDRVIAITRFSPGGSINSLENAGKVEVWGAEMEMVAIPYRGVEATLAYAFLSPKITEWVAPQFDAANQPIWTNPCGPGGVPGINCNTVQATADVANQRLVERAPENTVSIGLTYTAPPTTTGVFSAHVDTYWSDSWANQSLKAVSELNKAWSYAAVNGRLQLVDIPLQKGSLDLAVFGKNLFDRKYRTFGFDLTSALGWMVNSYGDPRTFGLGLTYHFTAS